jgi:hypothetical protein
MSYVIGVGLCLVFLIGISILGERGLINKKPWSIGYWLGGISVVWIALTGLYRLVMDM